MEEVSNSRRLKLTIRLAQSRLSGLNDAFWEHRRLAEIFPQYAFKLYCCMRASVPLMEAARERAREMEDDCPVAARLVPYFAQHIREEQHHDEWLLEDMELMGMSRAQVLASLPAPEAARLIGTLYYWVLHGHPVSLLAYLAVVEGNPVTTDTLDGVVARVGFPQDAFRTFYKHATLDVQHGKEVFRVLDGLPLTEYHNALLGISAIQVVDQLSTLLEGILS